MIATIDFETTGLKAGEDEVLQVSIIDENYNVLLNVYCRPNNNRNCGRFGKGQLWRRREETGK